MRSINLDEACTVPLGVSEKALSPIRFTTAHGREGWALRMPEPRPIATPAYADGMLFVGGGYGSFHFYAFDAVSGELAWQLRTSDDGPTAAVVEEGLVAFNTESCTVIVCKAATGEVVWLEWLGDPVMSQPAIAQGRLYIVYPKTRPNPTFHLKPDDPDYRKGMPEWQAGLDQEYSHCLLCANLYDGSHLWETPLRSDAMTAPVVADDKVYVAGMDGSTYCIDANSGEVIWEKREGATSSPLVVGEQLFFSEKESRFGRTVEGIRYRESESGDRTFHSMRSSSFAGYYSEPKSGGVSLHLESQKSLDASVGFSSAPSSAKLDHAAAHIGTSTVAGAWAYQGSRPAYARGHVFNAQGRRISSLHAETGKKAWQADTKSSQYEDDDQVFCPPSLGREYLYFTGLQGHLLSLKQDDATVDLHYQFPHAIGFQPALADGSVYFGTTSGMLIALDTGTKDAVDWHMWGGNPQHNRIIAT